jgi:hypothetical protein
MAKQNLTQPKDKTQQGDNRRAGDVDGNRGAKPKSGSQGVNESAANQPDATRGGGKPVGEEVGSTSRHSEAETLYRKGDA